MKAFLILNISVLFFVGCGGAGAGKSVNQPVAPAPHTPGAPSQTAKAQTKVLQLSVGDDFACALTESGVQCWGDNRFNQQKMPLLRSTTQIASGNLHTCAATIDGIKCWGFSSMADLVPPSLPGLIRLVSGDGFSCGYLPYEVRCWGRARVQNGDYVESMYLPELKNPTAVTGGANHMCALDDDGIHCWGGDAHNGELSIPTTLLHPKQIASGAYHICALDDGGVTCWGATNSPLINFGQTRVPRLSHPSRIFAGGYLSCAQDDTGLKCWGNGANTPADTKYSIPSEFGIGLRHACGIYAAGVHCWGKDNDNGQLNVPADFAY
jgi:alpha-tubulin suppressor-like RCC1 family protein